MFAAAACSVGLALLAVAAFAAALLAVPHSMLGYLAAACNLEDLLVAQLQSLPSAVAFVGKALPVAVWVDTYP